MNDKRKPNQRNLTQNVLWVMAHMIAITRSNNKDNIAQRIQGWIRTRESAFGVRLPLSVRLL